MGAVLNATIIEINTPTISIDPLTGTLSNSPAARTSAFNSLKLSG